jgi:hypothetical protein
MDAIVLEQRKQAIRIRNRSDEKQGEPANPEQDSDAAAEIPLIRR